MPNLREEISRTVLRLSRLGATPLASAADVTLHKPDPRAGQQLGSYRILRPLGSGGMGQVYLAIDTRLGRHVALKFLADETTADYVMLYRLQQEARTASALNHPNILTVYEIGELAGEHFIASEFIDGATLRTALERKAIDIPSAIDIAIQVASALVAAHTAGVVHRDLKPGNIMLRLDGYVKIIDFGLAKNLEKPVSAALAGEYETRPGSLVGTVHYMSPEQARGDKIDHHTDIWSLGVVLYEMLAGRRPFDGPSDSHTIVSILDAPWPPLTDVKSLPPGVSRIIESSLAKDPAKRYPSVALMLEDLYQISPASRIGSGVRFAALAHRAPTNRRYALSAGALLLLILLIAAWWWANRAPDWFQIGSVRQLTFNGRTNLATISPDGNYLAFVSGEVGGEQTLYLKQIDSSTEEVRIPSRHIDYVGLSFSPDSKYLYETEKDRSLLGKLYALPILGTRPVIPVVEDIDGSISFSPSGDQFAFVRYKLKSNQAKYETESAIVVASRDGFKQSQLMSSTDSTVYRCVAWSPRGNRIAAILFNNLPGHSSESMLDLIDLNGRESRQTLPNWRLIGRPSWLPDSESLILTSALSTQTRSQVQIRQIAVDTGRTHDISVGFAGYREATITRSGMQIAAAKLESRATIWVSEPQQAALGKSFPAEADERPTLAWSDATHLILNSMRSGYPNLWLFDLASQTGNSLTNERDVQQDAACLNDGKAVVFASNRSGQSKIWRFDRDAAVHTQLTFGPEYDESPSLSPDGSWIVYTSWVGNIPHLRKISSSGGDSLPITNSPAQNAQISPDGHWIASFILDPKTAQWGVAVIPFDGAGDPRPLPVARLPFRWSPDGQSLTTSLTDQNGVSNVWAVPLDGSAARQLTHFEDESISNLAWSPDGSRLACVRMRVGADIALLNRQESR